MATVDRQKAADEQKLIYSVWKGDISDATLVLAEGTDPNCRYSQYSSIDSRDDSSDLLPSCVDDDTSLHIAARNGNITLVKLLIVFDADPNLKNRVGETPLDVAVADCKKIIGKILTLRKKLSETRVRKLAKPSPKRDDDDVFLLSLDGGGIRGLVFIQAIIELDKRREQLYPESKPLLSYFNWIVGNSTGGLSALAFATGFDPIGARQIYFKLKNEILKEFPPFHISEVLQDTFGSEKTMSAIKDYNVAVLTTLADTNPPKLRLMRNYGESHDEQVDPDKRRIWEAAQATSAAVPYFNPFEDFVDGGFIANNPTVDALVDIRKHFKEQHRKEKLRVKAVISLGCGNSHPVPFEIPQQNWFQKMLDLPSGVAIIRALELLLGQITQPPQEVVERGEEFAEAIGAKYFRINPIIDSINFVECDDTKVIDMVYTSLLYMLENYTEQMDCVLEAIMEN